MRIKFIVPHKASDTALNQELYHFLSSHITNYGDIQVVDDKEDIVHVFGEWTHTWTHKVKNIRKREVPVVFTAMSGQASLYGDNGTITKHRALKKAIKQIANQGATIHVSGRSEMQALQSIISEGVMKTIHNPQYTRTTSHDEVAKAFVSLYEQAIIDNDQTIYNNTHNMVSQKLDKSLCTTPTEYDNIVNIATRILYVKHLLNKRAIPQSYLDQTSRDMIDSDYNEQLMQQLFKDLQKDKFVAYVMALLESNSTLTEGFMPISPKNGKMVDNMQKCIYNNI